MADPPADIEATTAAKIARSIAHEIQTRPKAKRVGDILPSVDAVTTEWLTDVLCRAHPGAEVRSLRIESVSSGTHERHRLYLGYNAVGDDAALPKTLFTKTLPTVQTRLFAGITGHARTEGRFYTELRPELDLEIPIGYQSTVDRESLAALHLLEDVVHTKGAVFCNYETYVTRDMAEDMLDLLAALHGNFYDDARLEGSFKWVAPYTKWFTGGVKKFRIDHYNDAALTEAAGVIPAALLKRRDQIWPATVSALKVHQERPSTFLHSDVHVGNWYRTAAGRMGLCDWQCAARGHWSRDVAYVLSAGLQIDDRRAWEKDLVLRYLDRLEQACGRRFEFADSWDLYRQQMLHALLMWTPTLCHSEHLPSMQPEAASLAMIERMTAAIDDLDSIGSCRLSI
jgi:hypothetical protein